MELNSKGLYQSSGKEKENGCFLFPSPTKREIGRFHVLVVQRRLRNVQKSVMHVQSCYFANLNLFGFCRSHCRLRRRCFKLPIVFFEREPTEALVDLITLRCQGFLRAALFQLNPIEYCVFRFSKERSGAYFCPT